MNIHSIYKITHIDTNRCYIGYSKNYKNRWNQYKSQKPGKTKRRIDHAIAKYGLDAFTFEVIYQSTDRDHVLNEMEDYFIDLYDSIANGFNMTRGGCAQPEDFLHSDEIRKKISEKTKEAMAIFTPEQRSLFAGAGKKKSPESNKKRSESIKASEKFRESRKIVADKHKENWKNPTQRMLDGIEKSRQANIGRVPSEEERRKISAGNRSSVVWLFKYNDRFHYVNGYANKYVDDHFPFHSPAIQSALKEYCSDAERKDKTKIVYGAVHKGVARGFEVTRMPESFMRPGEKLSWDECLRRAHYLVDNGYAKGDVVEIAKAMYEQANN